MRKLIFLCLLSATAFSQNIRYDNIAWGPKGPVANASIAVCSPQPANVSSSPCTPIAALCSSLTDVVCISPNPVTADALGNFHFYIATSKVPFTVQIYGPQVASPYVMTDQGVVGAGGTLTGSGTNGNYTGWNGPTGLTNAPATFSGLNSTFGGSVATTACSGCAGAVQIIGNTTPPALNANTFSILGPNSASFTAYGIQFPSTPPTNGQVPTAGTPSGGGIAPITWATPAGSGLPASPQIGDSVRYNVNGSGNWEATQGSYRNAVTLYHDGYGGGATAYGAVGQFGPTSHSTGSLSMNFSTATDSVSQTYTSGAAASTSTGISDFCCVGANYGEFGFSFYRWSLRFKPGQTTNARYWMGVTVYDVGGLAGEQVSVYNTTSMATDTPNRHLLGFRYSATTDTNWMCVASTGTAQTATSTTVAPDTTAAHTFEITYDGTTERCFIDGTLKASVTTNLPSQGTAKAEMFWTGDNQNNANTVVGTSYWMTMEMR